MHQTLFQSLNRQLDSDVPESASIIPTISDSSDYENYVPESTSFIPIISDSSNKAYSNDFSDFFSNSENDFSDSSIDSDNSSYSEYTENITDFLYEWFHSVKFLLKVH